MKLKEANEIASEFCDKLVPLLDDLRIKLDPEGYRVNLNTQSDGKVEVSVHKIEQSRTI